MEKTNNILMVTLVAVIILLSWGLSNNYKTEIQVIVPNVCKTHDQKIRIKVKLTCIMMCRRNYNDMMKMLVSLMLMLE